MFLFSLVWPNVQTLLIKLIIESTQPSDTYKYSIASNLPNKVKLKLHIGGYQKSLQQQVGVYNTGIVR